MNLYKFLQATVFLSATFLFFSCKPHISIKAGTNNEATILFSTGFSENTAKTLKALRGANTNEPLFNKDDVLSLLKNAGASNTSASIPSPTEITATGTLASVSKNQLAKTGLLKKGEKSLTLTIGPAQIVAFYALLDDETKSYFDLMMIPALIGEKMSIAEYTDLLASMYGPTFADEIINGELTISLSSPDGKKNLKKSLTLGELLTTEKELSWKIEF